MYKLLMRLYDEGRITRNGVMNAVNLGFITMEEANAILYGKGS